MEAVAQRLDLNIACEVNRAFPCIEANPQPADFMVLFAECNCHFEEDEEHKKVKAYCARCINRVLRAPVVSCSCGVQFTPGARFFADIVKLAV